MSTIPTTEQKGKNVDFFCNLQKRIQHGIKYLITFKNIRPENINHKCFKTTLYLPNYINLKNASNAIKSAA